jgi:signal transduction histidine kinase
MEDEGIELIRDIQPELPLVSIDAHRIEQVLLNLLSNAIRHTPSGGQIVVHASRLKSEVLVQIRDSGPGLSETDLEHVFDRFYRADEARSSDTGTGLGLSIAKALIEAHSGRIWAENAPEGGASFSFALPILPPPVSAKP